MLNSKYAPMVALTVLLVIIVGALGYFLAVKPQIDAASDYGDRESVVRSNIDKINEDSAALDQAKVNLASAPELGDLIALNAPQRPELLAFINRVAEAVRASQTEIRSITVEGVSDVERFDSTGVTLPSAALVGRFETVQTPREPGEPGAGETFTPVVVAPTPDANAVSNLVQVDFVVSVKGQPEEVSNFLSLMQDPDKRLFLPWDLALESRQSSDAQDTGVAPWLDGDATIELKGSLFLLNPDYSVIDELTKGTYTIPNNPSPLRKPAAADPQPGSPG